MKNCSNCKYSTDDEKGASLLCRRFPPVSHVIMVQGIAGPQPAFLSNYPGVSKNNPGCGEHMEKEKPLLTVV